MGVLRYTGPRSGSITSLGNALAAGETYLAKTPSFFMTKIAPLLFTMTSKAGLPARSSAKARSITFVAEARQYSTVRPVFLLNASMMGSTVLDSSEPYATILPLSFFAASMSFASWAATGEAANTLASSGLLKKIATRAKKCAERRHGFKCIIPLLQYSIIPKGLDTNQVQRIVFENELSLLR